MTSTRTRAPKVRPQLAVDETLPPVGQAVSIALRLLQESGAPSWNEFADPNDDGFRVKAVQKVHVTFEQGDLLDKFADVLTWLVRRPKTAEMAALSTTIAVCPRCGEFTVVTALPPASCKVTAECRRFFEEAANAEEKATVKPVKVKAAARVVDSDDDDEVEVPAPAPAPVPVKEVAVSEDGTVRPVIDLDDDDDDDDWGAPDPRTLTEDF